VNFFEKPILNSPYTMPQEHWELDQNGHPTDSIIGSRRRSDLISAMPQSKSSKKEAHQTAFDLSQARLAGQEFEYNVTEFVNEVRREVDVWRNLPNPAQWQVTPVTQRLLQHWRAIQNDPGQRIRPFFCQLEAAETAIWLAEVAPKDKRRGGRYRARLEAANV